MFYLAICFTLILIIEPVTVIDLLKKTPDNYGPYKLSTGFVDTCRGPKTLDQGTASCEFSNSTDDVITGTFIFNVSSNVRIEEAKLIVYNVVNGKKNLIGNYKYKNPCKHYIMNTVISLHFKSENCFIKAGLYKFDLDITETARIFFGPSFFYGEYYFKFIVLTKNGNFGCLIFDQAYEKKV